MKIELLYLQGCPNYEPTRRLIEQALAAEGLEAEVHEITVRSEQEAMARRFLGSPSVRVNGHDIEPGADRLSDFALKGRVYREEHRVAGVPAWRLLHAAFLEAALGQSYGCCRR